VPFAFPERFLLIRRHAAGQMYQRQEQALPQCGKEADRHVQGKSIRKSDNGDRPLNL
jgi:hypothetical protein